MSAAGRDGESGATDVSEIELKTPMIRLGQLLKLADVIDSGSAARAFLATGKVLVNGEPENRRGRQLEAGDRIVIGGRELVLRSRF